MAGRDPGDGWVWCDLGHRHWGLYGAAGLYVSAGEAVLLGRRAPGVEFDLRWGIPSGARHHGETAEDAAVRETLEETTLDRQHVTAPTGVTVDDHGGWTFTTVFVEAGESCPDMVWPRDRETTRFAWYALTDLSPDQLMPTLIVHRSKLVRDARRARAAAP